MGIMQKDGVYTADEAEVKRLETAASGVDDGSEDDVTGVPGASVKYNFMSVASGQGTALANFNQGSMVLGKAHCIAKLGEPLEVVIMRADRYYRDYIGANNYDPSKLPTEYATAEAAKAAGKTLEWINNVAPTAKPAFKLLMFFQEPDMDDVLPYTTVELDGKVYIPVLYRAVQSAYDSMAPIIDAVFQKKCKGANLPMRAARFKMWTEKRVTKFKSMIVEPKLQFIGMNSDKFLSDIGDMVPKKLGASAPVQALAASNE